MRYSCSTHGFRDMVGASSFAAPVPGIWDGNTTPWPGMCARKVSLGCSQILWKNRSREIERWIVRSCSAGSPGGSFLQESRPPAPPQRTLKYASSGRVRVSYPVAGSWPLRFLKVIFSPTNELMQQSIERLPAHAQEKPLDMSESRRDPAQPSS